VTIWLDAHVSPALGPWIEEKFGVPVRPVRELGLLRAKDTEIFFGARSADAIVMTKDSDFLILLDRYGPPPNVIWLTGGNTSTARLQEVLAVSLAEALRLIGAGDPLVEINCRR
jgi:predicted nuclease of predicted toxin-antitoxin system